MYNFESVYFVYGTFFTYIFSYYYSYYSWSLFLKLISVHIAVMCTEINFKNKDQDTQPQVQDRDSA